MIALEPGTTSQPETSINEHAEYTPLHSECTLTLSELGFQGLQFVPWSWVANASHDVTKSSEIADCAIGDLGCDARDGQGSGNKIGR